MQSLEASHPAWLPAGPWHRRCPFPGAGVPRQSPLSAAGAPSAPSSGLQRCPPGSAAPYIPLERARVLGVSVGQTQAAALPPPFVRLLILPAGPPLPQRNGAGETAAGRAGGHPPGWSRFLGTLGRQRGSLPAGCLCGAPREGLFSAGAGTRAQGAGLPSMCRFLPC